MAEWEEVELGDCISTNDESIKVSELNDVVEYWDTGAVTKNNFDSPQIYDIENLPSRARRIIRKGDSIISSVRPNHEHHGLINFVPKTNCLVSTGFIVVRPNQNRIQPSFLYNFLRLPETTEWLQIVAEGSTSTYPSMKAADVESLTIQLPYLQEQEAIAEVLSSLDDKIDLLKRQNKTLEGMAEALFRQWFIEEAQDDWEEIELNKHLEFGSGFPFKSNTYLEQGQYRIATIKHVQDGFLDLSDAPFLGCLPEKIKPHCILNQGDVILSLTGNVGRCCMVDKDNVLLNQRVASILPYDGAQLPFWYFFFRYPAIKGILDQLSHGTAQKNLSTRVLGFEKFQLPPTNEICSRVPAFKAIFYKILDNHKTMEILESQRDTLLPKLMSGEVRVQMD